MKEHDPLNSVLREWEGPGTAIRRGRARSRGLPAGTPPVAVAAHLVRASDYPRPRAGGGVPAAACTVLWLQLRRGRPRRSPRSDAGGTGYMTRVETAGFKPLPDGATRVIRSGGWKQ